MKLDEMFSLELLTREIEGGYVRVQSHPSLPLFIYNYTEKTQFGRRWNPITLACRGLIVNDQLDVVARPFRKFFNWEENKNVFSLDEPVMVTDKMDGSLGIMYQAVPGTKTVPRISTRGSFTSDQAKHAQHVLDTKYHDFYPRMGWTLLFEIVYPENRIVVDYDGMDDLVLLGGVDIVSGAVQGPEIAPDWPGPVVETFSYRTLREALSAEPRKGKEGLVIRSLMDGTMIKLKQEDYVQLHKIVTGLNERVVWERLAAGTDVFDGIPDEWHDWVNSVASPLMATQQDMFNQVVQHRSQLFHDGKMVDRKTFALAIMNLNPWLRSALWLLYDRKLKQLDEFLWNQVKPRGDKTNG